MMLKSVERLLEFVGDMNATEINDHIKARPDGFVVSFRIDGEWLDGWNRAVLATVEKIEKEVAERYMELPLDADGVPIRVGDVLTDGEHTYTVTSVTFDSFAVTVCGYSETSLNSWPIDQPGKMRHHHAPTVEDVLRDMLDSLDLDPTSHVDRGAVIAEFAAKLRLAGGE